MHQHLPYGTRKSDMLATFSCHASLVEMDLFLNITTILTVIDQQLGIKVHTLG